MDFKIAGTEQGITAIQMDTKIAGLTWEIIEQTFSQALIGRMHILSKMLEVIPSPRADLSPFAPRIYAVRIPPEKIGELIGPGGKNINKIITDAGGREIVSIDIEDDGLVMVSSINSEAANQCLEAIKGFTVVVQVGEVYDGIVVQIVRDRMDPKKEIGAIVEFLGTKSGMIHISQVANERIERVSDYLKEGQEVKVRVVGVDTEKNRIALSIKDV
jgi:polyribonucleotide nucleotidyltransferase